MLRPDPIDRDCASTAAHAPDADVTASPVAEGGLGERMYALVEALYPICRSITGNGALFRATSGNGRGVRCVSGAAALFSAKMLNASAPRQRSDSSTIRQAKPPRSCVLSYKSARRPRCGSPSACQRAAAAKR